MGALLVGQAGQALRFDPLLPSGGYHFGQQGPQAVIQHDLGRLVLHLFEDFDDILGHRLVRVILGHQAAHLAADEGQDQAIAVVGPGAAGADGPAAQSLPGGDVAVGGGVDLHS